MNISGKKCLILRHDKICVMKLGKIIQELESVIPTQLQESYDNSGLQVGNRNAEIKKTLISMDITMEVLEEAKIKGCDLVISHHPMLFRAVKNIDAETEPGVFIHFAIKNDIAIYSMHTSIDKYRFGVSHSLATKLGLKNIKTLQPEKDVLKKLVTFCPTAQSKALRKALFNAGAGHIGDYDSCSFNVEGSGTFRALEDTNPFVGERGELHTEHENRIEVIFPVWKKSAVIKALLANHPYEEVAHDVYSLENQMDNTGLGVVGELKQPLIAGDFLKMLQGEFGQVPLRFSEFEGKILKVALCGGSGASLINMALSVGADAFLSGDIKYHDFQFARNKILMVDAGHYETEIQVLRLISELISEKMPTFANLISETNTNFVKYFK